jgi:hypothetical protein
MRRNPNNLLQQACGEFGYANGELLTIEKTAGFYLHFSSSQNLLKFTRHNCITK